MRQQFSFGLEHEVAFIRTDGQFVDSTNTTFDKVQAIVDQLPSYPGDYPQLRIGDAGIKEKRWYVEGFERFSMDGSVWDCPPKGIEIRTTIHPSIDKAVQELSESYHQLINISRKKGYLPATVSFHPFSTSFEPDPPLNAYEIQRRKGSPEKASAYIPMSTFGPDLSLSVKGSTTDEIIDLGKKLTYYSPFIIPFSFSSPFYNGELWGGYSRRTYVRTGIRPAVMVFFSDKDKLIKSSPSLTQLSRVTAEIGRIEFKAFDSCFDFSLYKGLLALLKGIVLDKSLDKRALIPDKELHQHVSKVGFNDSRIEETAHLIIEKSQRALKNDNDSDEIYLLPLKTMLEKRETPAHQLIKSFEEKGGIAETITHVC